ncbi:MAG: hydrogenobyrinic acid a,c-diamide synthase (glutamine-hydrolyzing) [Nitrospirae bacterium]|nr:hydrogenobyrinic acid a,c-diamide synthase (glutamine-hydrolyzing) [Nitrospirota bacterium]
MFNYPRILCAGIKGGSGKTTVTLGIIAALRAQKSLTVIPYKKGPDYIDVGWMSVAAGMSCYNLDPFMLTKEKVFDSFISHFSGDVAVIEGNRGLYDGMDAAGSYSTAEVAKLLKAPVILVIDCAKMTRTAAAVVLGCMNMDREVLIKGVVLNQVSGSRHESIVRASIEQYCAVPVIGAMPRFQNDRMPERHMGLIPFHEHRDIEGVISFAHDMARKHLDIDAIFEIAAAAEPLPIRQKREDRSQKTEDKVRIGVIRDSAFQFYYPENIEELERSGAAIININAMDEDQLPQIDALYIGGGFPETNAVKIAGNKEFRMSVKAAAEAGLPIYAECGGLMFLGESLIVGGNKYPMADVLPLVFEMKERPQAHGYTIVEVEKENPFYPVGTIIHGHEFHYSAVEMSSKKNRTNFAFGMKRGKGIKNGMDGICYKNVLGTYTHVHALGTETWAEGLISRAKAHKDGNRIIK